MIDGYFGDNNLSKKESIESTYIQFKNGSIQLSKYFYRNSNTEFRFLVRKKSSNFYEEIINNKRLGEKLIFSSNLLLLKDKFFQEQIRSNASIIIVYDELLNEISIVRDTFGTIPLYYFHTSSFFAFSTDIKSLVSQQKNFDASKINIEMISTYLTHLSDVRSYSQDTFYNKISAVLPGHFVHFSNSKVITEPVIYYQPQKWKHLTTIEEFGEEFKHIFKESVKRCILNQSNLSSQLSGGLDSSSVSSMIRNIAPELQFYTLYCDTNTTLTDESFYAEKVAQFINSNHYVIYPSTNDLDLLIKNIELYGFPEHMSLTPSLKTASIVEASSLGSDILMTGTDGDSIVGHGFNYLDNLFAQGEWNELKIALSDWASASGGLGASKGWEYLTAKEKKQLTFTRFFYRKLSGANSSMQAMRIMYVAKSKFDISYSDLLWKGFEGLKNRIRYLDRLPFSIHSKQLISEKKIEPSNPKSFPFTFLNSFSESYSFVLSDVFNRQAILINEESFHLAKFNNIELGYPFYNFKLLELCMATPFCLKFNHGKSRGHLREAMRGILLDDVRNRPDKGIFNEFARQATLRLYSKSGDFLSDSNEVWNYVDRNQFQKCVALFKADNHLLYIYNRTSYFINRTIYLSIWLSQQK